MEARILEVHKDSIDTKVTVQFVDGDFVSARQYNFISKEELQRVIADDILQIGQKLEREREAEKLVNVNLL